jgi:peptidoglycan/xylan/chitin deacetylase (PgdA/CDA1 family)
MVSFTFDDAAASAGDEGAAMLEEFGARGTYYIASEFTMCDEFRYPLLRRDKILELHRAGHEIGLHSHKHIPGARLTAAEFERDLKQNRDWLRSIDDGIQAANFAYPHGLASYPRKRQLRDMVHSSRGIVPGVIKGVFDSHLMPCVELAEEKLTLASLRGYLDEVARVKGWLIFCSHDIAEAPTRFGCTPSMFRKALEGAAARDIAVVTVAGGLRRAKPLKREKPSNTTTEFQRI